MAESNQPVTPKQVRDVVALGKKASKTAFPNPTREGCPNSSTLRAMAYRDRQLSLNDIPVSHVVSCSPCFQEYSRLRRIGVVVRGIKVTAASLAVAIPATFGYNIFASRLNRFDGMMERFSAAVIARLVREGQI